MPLTEADFDAINKRALPHASELDRAILAPNGSPGPLATAINPRAAGRCEGMHLFATGQWAGIGGRGDDLIDLVAHVASVDRDEAALALDRWLDHAGPPPPPIARQPGDRFRQPDPPPERKPAPPRSLRRVS
jgi:hypothetical protein